MKKCADSDCKADNPDEAHYCHMCGTKLSSSSEEDSTNKNVVIDKKILDIIKQNSFSKRPLAAYKARKYANNVCKEAFGKK